MDQRLPDPAGAAPPDWRGLCEELLRELENAIAVHYGEGGTHHISAADAVIAKADAALSQPEPEVVGPSDEELDSLERQHWEETGVEEWGRGEAIFNHRAFARAAIARWGRPALAPAGAAPPDWRGLCQELLQLAGSAQSIAVGEGLWDGDEDEGLLDRARAALAESATSDYKVASEDTMRRIRSTTKRWRINVIISTNDSSIDTRIGCGIWKCLDIEREILESVSLPEYLPAIKETTND